MTNEETDTALILENELKRRVYEVVREVIHRAVKDEVKEVLAAEKQAMMLEMGLTLGKILQDVEKENRQPLWVTGPQAMKEMQHALHQQTPPV